VTEQTNPLVLSNLTILDGTGAPPVPGQALIIEGRRISWIGPADQLPEASAATAVDAGGATAMPGLINCHVHLTNDGSPDLYGHRRGADARSGADADRAAAG
jgi:imidazolonepropionase-like amidohydrolase